MFCCPFPPWRLESAQLPKRFVLLLLGTSTVFSNVLIFSDALTLWLQYQYRSSTEWSASWGTDPFTLAALKFESHSLAPPAHASSSQERLLRQQQQEAWATRIDDSTLVWNSATSECVGVTSLMQNLPVVHYACRPTGCPLHTQQSAAVAALIAGDYLSRTRHSAACETYCKYSDHQSNSRDIAFEASTMRIWRLGRCLCMSSLRGCHDMSSGI